MKYSRPAFDDPDDLGRPSREAITMFFQVELLDFARRYSKRKGDPTSIRRSEELKKILVQTSKMQAEALRALVPSEILHKHFEYIKNTDQWKIP